MGRSRRWVALGAVLLAVGATAGTAQGLTIRIFGDDGVFDSNVFQSKMQALYRASPYYVAGDTLSFTSVGSGKALTSGEQGFADVVIADSPPLEQKFLAGQDITPPPPLTGPLLQRYAPQLDYDMGEQYFADSAAEITDNTESSGSNTLQRNDGTIIAAAQPGTAPGLLGLGFLTPTYPVNVEGTTALSNDWIDELNDYQATAARLHANPNYANQMYGHAVVDPNGTLWLQYWFFSYYNPTGAPFNAEVHEGDWEMIQIRLNASNVPDELTFAQHNSGSHCAPRQVEWSGTGGPIVYVALGTHASYPAPGTYSTSVPGYDDDAYGDGPNVTPTVSIITNTSPSWVLWPGHWGNSKGGGLAGAASPGGPSTHAQFAQPQAFDNASGPCTGNMVG